MLSRSKSKSNPRVRAGELLLLGLENHRKQTNNQPVNYPNEKQWISNSGSNTLTLTPRNAQHTKFVAAAASMYQPRRKLTFSK